MGNWLLKNPYKWSYFNLLISLVTFFGPPWGRQKKRLTFTKTEAGGGLKGITASGAELPEPAAGLRQFRWSGWWLPGGLEGHLEGVVAPIYCTHLLQPWKYRPIWNGTTTSPVRTLGTTITMGMVALTTYDRHGMILQVSWKIFMMLHSQVIQPPWPPLVP